MPEEHTPPQGGGTEAGRPPSFTSLLDDIGPEIADVLDKIVQVGAAVTGTLARAGQAEAGSGGEGPLDELVRNGATAVAAIVRMTVESLRDGTGLGTRAGGGSGAGAGAATGGRGPAAPGGGPGAATRPSRPAVYPGDTLRVPLFIENPSDDDTGPLTFTVLEATSPPSADGDPIEQGRVRCIPGTLSIAAHDFEKLTVLVETTPTTRTGPHRLKIGVADTPFVTTIDLDVLPSR